MFCLLLAFYFLHFAYDEYNDGVDVLIYVFSWKSKMFKYISFLCAILVYERFLGVTFLLPDHLPVVKNNVMGWVLTFSIFGR